ncbi:Alpha/Beta hydrolase protein [Xylaria telfairii]|nr:Alpha/Beta hydrolase protein [Xylaria telfairii]
MPTTVAHQVCLSRLAAARHWQRRKKECLLMRLIRCYSIFFPRDYDQTLPQTLPTVFIIHGGGFCMGSPEDDDVWSERFATMHNVLVIELNYRKAPAHPFPTAMYDIEALMLAVLNDESLPLDKSRIAVGGFFAGGSLTLSVCQLPSIHDKVRPAAVIAIYPLVDQTIHTREKLKMRHYKPDLKTGTRGKSSDLLAGWGQTFRWSYIPIGHDLRDPLLSPYFALRDDLPPHVFLIGAELDHLSHEAWRMANKLAGRAVPSFTEMAGQERPAHDSESLILDNERFAFEQVDVDGGKSVRWLLVPDEAHGFGKEALAVDLAAFEIPTNMVVHRPFFDLILRLGGSGTCCTFENCCVPKAGGPVAS